MLVWHFVRFYVIILEVFTVIRLMLLCAEIGNFPFLKQLSIVILLDFSADREKERGRLYFVLKLKLTRFVSCILWLFNLRGEAIFDLVDLREHASSNKLNIYIRSFSIHSQIMNLIRILGILVFV